jgi:predicted nucleotidyltransferase
MLRKSDEQDPLRGVIRIESLDSYDAESVDIVLGIRNMPQGIFERSTSLQFLGHQVPVISPEDLIVLKCLAGGPIDLEDARSILEVMKGKLDMKYLEGELKRSRLSMAKLKR